MGAFNFAADTLALITTAFAPRNEVLTSVSLTNLSVDLDDNAHRIFNEFSTGMKMLNQHGTRNPCNVAHISQQNLKLLHNNLKANRSYRVALMKIKECADTTSHWASLPLVNNANIIASVLYLPANTDISNSSSTNALVSANDLNSRFVNNFDTEKFQQLYLSLDGCSKLDINHHLSNSNIMLKNGSGFATAHPDTQVTRISAIQGRSLLLRIQLPTT